MWRHDEPIGKAARASAADAPYGNVRARKANRKRPPEYEAHAPWNPPAIQATIRRT